MFKEISFLQIAGLGGDENDKQMVWALMLRQVGYEEKFERVGIAEFAPEAGGEFDPDPWEMRDITIV
jgi:hypothetical protein